MFVRAKKKDNEKFSIQIVETYRKADKVHQKIIRHVGQAVTEREVEELKKLAQSIIIEMKNKKKPVLPIFSPEDFFSGKKKEETAKGKVDLGNLREEQRMIDGIGDIFGNLYTDLGFDNILSEFKKDEQKNAILKSCVLARIANPTSKRRTASVLEEDYGIKIPLDKIYRMMDFLSEKEDLVKNKICETTLSYFKTKVEVLFFDVTTLYFESIKTDDLKDFGFSKDCKFKESQVVLALVTTTNGLPITYRLFPGNTYEGHTLIDMIDELEKEFEVSNVLLVADRAMFNNDNLDLMESKNINYVVSARLKNLTKKQKKDILEDDDFNAKVFDNKLHWVKEYDYKSRRLVVSYNSARAKKDAADRQRLVDRLMKKVKDGKVKIKDIIPNYGTKKYLQISHGEATVNEAKIDEDAKWDGLYGVISNVKSKAPEELLQTYHGLWQIEEAFRVNKHDLKMRPIYHWTEKRIKAHISLCFLAFTLVKQATYRLSIQQTPMSFEQLRNELLHTQSSILVDLETKNKYRLPSKVTINQKNIYQAFGLKRTGVIRKII